MVLVGVIRCQGGLSFGIEGDDALRQAGGIGVDERAELE